MMYHKKSERGQALIIIVVAIIALIGMTGLTVDLGRTYVDRQGAQTGADSAALGAALAKVRNQNITTAANAIAETNGYVNGDKTTITVTNPIMVATTGCNGQSLPSEYRTTPAEADKYIHVKIISHVDASFAKLVGVNQMENCVEAVARVVTATSGGGMSSGAAIVALAPSGCGMNFTSSTITTTGGGLFINSTTNTPTSADSALCSNWAPVVNTSGGCIAIASPGSAGKNFTNGSQTLGGTTPGFCSPQPAQIAVPDYASMVPVPPTPPTCASPGTKTESTQTGIGTYTPGSFASITVPFTSGTFASGVYCLSGNLSVTGGATVTGGDVTFVFTGANNGASIGGSTHSTYSSLQIYTQNGNYSYGGSSTLNVPGVFRFFATGTANYSVGGDSGSSAIQTLNDGFFYLNGGVMDWQGSTTLNLKAPTYAPYKGVAIYSPVTNTQTMTIMGGSNVNVTGTILHPGGTIKLNGSATANALNSQIIGNRITTGGTGIIKVNYDPSLNIGSPAGNPTIELVK